MDVIGLYPDNILLQYNKTKTKMRRWSQKSLVMVSVLKTTKYGISIMLCVLKDSQTSTWEHLIPLSKKSTGLERKNSKWWHSNKKQPPLHLFILVVLADTYKTDLGKPHSTTSGTLRFSFPVQLTVTF